MRTVESFYKPGLEPVADVMAQLAETPRSLHAKGLLWGKIWRVAVFLICLAATIVCCYRLYGYYVESGKLLSWVIAVAIVPLTLGYLPWWLTTSYIRRVRTFEHCRRIYQDGTPVLGTVNTITNVTGPDQNCHHIEHKRSSSRSKVRVDYTFAIDNVIKTGSVLLRESSVRYLKVNDDICVIYQPDLPSDSIIFPVPGYDFFEMVKCQT